MHSDATKSELQIERGLVLRARFIAIGFACFFIVTWLAVFYPFNDLVDRFGAPLGGDFPMFYVAGQTVVDGQVDQLYDDRSQHERLHALLPGLAADYTLPFRYPPLVAWATAPLALLSYPAAFAIFAGLMLSCWWSASWLLSQHPTAQRSQLAHAAWWLMIAWPIGWEAVIGGQASPLALLIIAGTWYLLRTDRQLLAGAVLALAMYKPNVLAFLALGCLIARPRMLCGALSVWIVLVVLTVINSGFEGSSNYVQYAAHLAVERWADETPFWKVQGLGNVLAPIAYGYERTTLLSIGLLLTVLIGWQWRARTDVKSAACAVTALLVVNYLCNPYVPIYDLLTLMAAAAIAVQAVEPDCIHAMLRDRRVQATMLLIFVGPHLSQAIARTIGWQIFPPAMAATAIYWIISIVRRTAPLAALSNGSYLCAKQEIHPTLPRS